MNSKCFVKYQLALTGEGMNPEVKKHFKLQIKTLQDVPRDSDKLQALLRAKEREQKQQGL
jgi:hypothetical protein